MRKFPLLFVFLMTLIACRAAPLEVRYNFDRGADFSKFKTYKWVTLKDTAKIDVLRDKQVKDTVDAELARKGMTRTDAETADLYLGYQAGVDTQRQFTTYKADWGYGSGWSKGGWYSGVGGMVTEQTALIYIGQLAVDVYDATNHSLVWRGVANKTIDPNATPEKQQKNLAKAIAKLLSNYPPPSPEGVPNKARKFTPINISVVNSQYKIPSTFSHPAISAGDLSVSRSAHPTRLPFIETPEQNVLAACSFLVTSNDTTRPSARTCLPLWRT